MFGRGCLSALCWRKDGSEPNGDNNSVRIIDVTNTVDFCDGWKLQYNDDWIPAAVPGTVLHTLVVNGVYDEPLVGYNNDRIPDSICRQSWTYAKTFRIRDLDPNTDPNDVTGLTFIFEGINYEGQFVVNGQGIGSTVGAFKERKFYWRRRNYHSHNMDDDTDDTVSILLKVSPQPNPGVPHRHTIRDGMGRNGGDTAKDGPTFLCSIGWDWLTAIHDRNTGIWQPVRVEIHTAKSDKHVRYAIDAVRLSTLALRKPEKHRLGPEWNGKNHKDDITESSEVDLPLAAELEVRLQLTQLRRTDGDPHPLDLVGIITTEADPTSPVGTFRYRLDPKTELPSDTSPVVHLRLNSRSTGCANALLMKHPRLWWTHDLGSQPLYRLTVQLQLPPARRGGIGSLHRVPKVLTNPCSVVFGVRKFHYSVGGSGELGDGPLAVSINGVPLFLRGGNWGMDEGLKRIFGAAIDQRVAYHVHAGLNLIRNWVGQSTSEALYDACDRHGLLLWDEFFQPNPSDGPDPLRSDIYLDNARSKVMRFGGHPCVLLYCGRNEGYPPPLLDDGLRRIVATFGATGTPYVSSSGKPGAPPPQHPRAQMATSPPPSLGVQSGGPYCWRPPQAYYHFDSENEITKSEIGSVSIPSWQSIRGMLPDTDLDLNAITDAWAHRDLARGASRGDTFPADLAQRYGEFRNARDFALKGSVACYESHRALFEGRLAALNDPCRGVFVWMSNPAQPSFVWQLYHHDMEPCAALYATRKACEPVHVMLNEDDYSISVIAHREVSEASTLDLIVKRLFVGTQQLETFTWQNLPLPSGPMSTLRAVKTGSEDDEGNVWRRLKDAVVVCLELRANAKPTDVDTTQFLLSRNVYWHRGIGSGKENIDLSVFAKMPKCDMTVSVMRPLVRPNFSSNPHPSDCPPLIVTFSNSSEKYPLMCVQAQLWYRDQCRLLPVFWSDNCVTLLPSESTTVQVNTPWLKTTQVEDLRIRMVGLNLRSVTNAPNNVAPGMVMLDVESDPRQHPETGLPIKEGSPIFG
eukprot:Clim_evm68s144 gene=Clim_evmTU68s144